MKLSNQLIKHEAIKRQLLFWCRSFFLYRMIAGGIILMNLPVRVDAQQLPVYSQYTFNAFLLNPAVAGAEGYTAINATSREQWMGMEGAPTTNSISFQTRIMKRKPVESGASVKKRYLRPLRSGRVGLGLNIHRDHSGISDQTGVHFTYAYHIDQTKSQFSFGLTLSFFQYFIDMNNIRLPDSKDNMLNNQSMSVIMPDINIGCYYTNQNMFGGISILNLSESSIAVSNYKESRYKMERQYNMVGGFKYDLNETTQVEPSAYIKTSEQWKPQFDLMTKVIFDGKFWLGLGYRYGGTVIGTLGARINRCYIGYSYDYNSNLLSRYSYGTHELMIALKLGDNTRRYRWMERY